MKLESAENSTFVPILRPYRITAKNEYTSREYLRYMKKDTEFGTCAVC